MVLHYNLVNDVLLIRLSYERRRLLHRIVGFYLVFIGFLLERRELFWFGYFCFFVVAKVDSHPFHSQSNFHISLIFDHSMILHSFHERSSNLNFGLLHRVLNIHRKHRLRILYRLNRLFIFLLRDQLLRRYFLNLPRIYQLRLVYQPYSFIPHQLNVLLKFIFERILQL